MLLLLCRPFSHSLILSISISLSLCFFLSLLRYIEPLSSFIWTNFEQRKFTILLVFDKPNTHRREFVSRQAKSKSESETESPNRACSWTHITFRIWHNLTFIHGNRLIIFHLPQTNTQYENSFAYKHFQWCLNGNDKEKILCVRHRWNR